MDMRTLPAIRITRADLDEILGAGTESGGVFSCNDRCEVWIANRRGSIHPKDRRYVDLPQLDEIAAAVVKAWPRGGRFRVSREGVVLLSGPEPLFCFEVA
jgi:hypothetical protein